MSVEGAPPTSEGEAEAVVGESPAQRAQRIGCYCELWETSPEHYVQQGVPPGFCGLCQTCGQPGHTRHFPGSAPCTGCWCDAHYRRLAVTHPYGAVGCPLYALALMGALALLALVGARGC